MAGRRGRKEAEPNRARIKSDAAHQLGETIRAWRHERGLTIGELADQAKIESGGRAYISKLEHGRIERIGPARLKDLAAALDISPEEIERGDRPDTSAGQIAHSIESARRASVEEAITDVLERRLDDLLAAALRTAVPRFRAEAQRVIADSLPSILAEARREQEIELFQHILRQAGRGRPLLATAGAAGSAEQHIEGTEACLRAAIQLIESAPEVEEPGTQEISITWRGEQSLIESTADPLLRQEWIGALRVALDRGYTIRHLVTIGENQHKALLIVLNILALLGSRGLYSPLLLAPERAAVPRHDPRDFIAVPGKGVVELCGLERGIFYPPGRDSALFAEIDAMAVGATELYRSYPRFSTQFVDAIVETDRQPGHRYLAMQGLSEGLVPFAVHQARAEPLLAVGGDVGDHAAHLLKARSERERMIEEQLEHYRYRDLCTERAIRDLVEKGTTSPDDALLQLGAPPLTEPQRVLVLRAVVERMLRFPNYELILLPDALADLCRTFYFAKAGYAVLLEFWRPPVSEESEPEPGGAPRQTGRREQVDILIREPTIVRAFCESPLWQPYSADAPKRRQQTIGFLERQIAALEAL